MRDKWRAILGVSAGPHTVKSSGKSTDTSKAIVTTQVKHRQEKHDEESKANSCSFLTRLKTCAQKKDLYQVSRIHNQLRNSGLLQKDAYLGSTLVSVYAKCGALTKAREILDGLPVRNVITWNALIAVYAQHGCGKDALCCFHQMQRGGFSPDAVSYACALKACGLTQDLHMGEIIHNEIASQGWLEKHVVLGNALVDMYAKCGALMKARKVLDGLPFRDVISWSTLIAGYAQHGCGKEALCCFHHMRREGLSPDAISYACTLKACGLTQDVHTGLRIHDEIASQGLLEKHVVLGGALVDMYAKCGALTKAREVLDGLPLRDVVSWNTLIAGYAQHGCGKEALGCFDQMGREGLSPNAITYACTLKACGLTKDLHVGGRIHDEIASQRLLEKHIVLGNALIDMYAKCGSLAKALKVLDGLPLRDIVSWSTLIAGYAQHGFGKEALCCFHRMRREGLSPDAISYACTLKACGLTQDLCMGERIHNEIASQGLFEKNVVLGNALVDMYAKCGGFMKAREVLDGLSVRNVDSWNALIAGYAQHGCGKQALCCFLQMRREGLSPDAISYACALKACSLTQDLHMGERIHDDIASQGLLEKHVVLGNALVDMYAKCGALRKARKVLDGLALRNVVSWNALIVGYAQYGCAKEALGCLHRMQREGLSPDVITYSCTLKACGLTQDLRMGERIHKEIASQGLLENHVVLGNALVDMYAKCGALMIAREVLDGLPQRDVVSWSALIAGFAEHGCGKEALGCFHQMRREGISPDAISYACTMKACGLTQDLHMGEIIHNEIASQGLLEKHVVLGGVLVDMYAKCGALTKAREVLDGLPLRDVVSWNTLIAGYAEHGCGKEALNCLCWMQHEGTSPTAITILSVLNACSHSGQLDAGQMLFDIMREEYGIIPDKEHYTCMVDLFGRAKLFDKAMRVIKMMPSSDYPPVWSALLGACRQGGNVELGSLAFECVIELYNCNAAAYG